MNKQIKSKKRVEEHGEVFTADREVDDMLSLVNAETQRIESRFLEPACGNGAFLIKVLMKKLDAVSARYGSFHADYEKFSFLALTTLYGVDIQEDNVIECRERLFAYWKDKYRANCKNDCMEAVISAAHYVLERNILCGDALTMLNNDGNPIIFSQWDFTIGNLIKRRDYQLDFLLKDEEAKSSITQQITFEMLMSSEWEYDEDSKTYIRGPIAEYKPVNYWEVQNNVESI